MEVVDAGEVWKPFEEDVEQSGRRVHCLPFGPFSARQRNYAARANEWRNFRGRPELQALDFTLLCLVIKTHRVVGLWPAHAAPIGGHVAWWKTKSANKKGRDMRQRVR
jgi:hypothetical protein